MLKGGEGCKKFEKHCTTVWKQKIVDLRNNWEITENYQLLGKIKKNAEEEIMKT